MLTFHFARLLHSIERKLSFHQKYHNPWMIEVVEFIAPHIFEAAFKAIQDYIVRRTVSTNIIKYRNGSPKEYIISFSHSGPFKFHLKQLSGIGECEKFFCKSNKLGNIAKIDVSEENRATLTYKPNTGSMKVTIKYNVTNKYGNVVSF